MDIISNFIRNKNHIICGDFNSNNSLWGSTITNARGEAIHDFIDNNFCSLINDGSVTKGGKNTSSSSIDLTLCEISTSDRISNWKVLDENLGSDHFIINWTFSCRHKIIIEKNKYKIVDKKKVKEA